MKNQIKFIPGLFTILNLFCGFLSLINSSNGNQAQACLFVIYAALFDAFDGIVARFTGTSSKFGAELDSLSDIVSFGAAPSFIIYKFSLFQNEGLGIALSSLLMIFASLRLARFNTQLVGLDKEHFIGLPVPVSALTAASFFLFYHNKNFSPELSGYFVYSMSIVLPFLMVSRFRYETAPKFTQKDIKLHPVKFVIVVISLILIFITKGEGLFIFCLFYISTGVIRGIKNSIKKFIFRKKGGSGETEDYKLRTEN